MMRPTALIALILLLSTACGDDDTSDSTTAPGQEQLTVAEALDAEGPVRVFGYLFVLDDETAVLADLILESFPPQPGGATVTVEGLNLDTLDLEQAPTDSEGATAQWADNPVTLTGSLVSGVLVDAEAE
jgi:hypothetical protein